AGAPGWGGRGNGPGSRRTGAAPPWSTGVAVLTWILYVSLPAPPSSVSLPPPTRVSSPSPATSELLPGPANNRSPPDPPMRVSSPSPPSRITGTETAAAEIRSLPPIPRTSTRSTAGPGVVTTIASFPGLPASTRVVVVATAPAGSDTSTRTTLSPGTGAKVNVGPVTPGWNTLLRNHRYTPGVSSGPGAGCRAGTAP